MTCCHLMGMGKFLGFYENNLTGMVHSVLLRLVVWFLNSFTMTETGGNLMEQGQGYREDASTQPSQAHSIIAAWL